ncbi:MAG: CoA ester lyase [Rhodospirillaceae bacterium]|nr:CoA ester lyase [Rhodospirillaceae bacterium]
MTASHRPRRSVLYMPGSNPRALEKGRGLPADVIIMDLEDAVAPEAKQTARDLIGDAISYGGYGERELVVRTNALETEWGDADLVFAATSGADALLLAKVENAETVQRAEAALVAAGAPESLAIWCMMETPGAMLRADEIAAATPRLAALVMGTTDLTKDLRARATPDRLAMLPSLGLCLLAARAHGLAALDGVHMDLSDDAGFRAACKQGRDLGFDGKTLIHPKTLAGANEIFAPQPQELDFARRIIAAHGAAEAEGLGVVLLDGKLIEALHVVEAKRLLALEAAISAPQ